VAPEDFRTLERLAAHPEWGISGAHFPALKEFAVITHPFLSDLRCTKTMDFAVMHRKQMSSVPSTLFKSPSMMLCTHKCWHERKTCTKPGSQSLTQFRFTFRSANSVVGFTRAEVYIEMGVVAAKRYGHKGALALFHALKTWEYATWRWRFIRFAS